MITPKNILIIRSDRIGDVVLSIPMAEAIKNKYPECKVTFLVRSYTAPLLTSHKFIDEIKILEESNKGIELFSNIKKLKHQKFDWVITAYPSFKIALIAFFSNITNRIGTAYRWYSFLFNKKAHIRRKSGNGHELEYNLLLLEKLGISANPEKGNVNFYIQPDAKSEQKVENLLNDVNYDFTKKTVILHPGSGGSAIDYPISKQIELAKLMAQQLDCNIIVTGSESEKEICSKFSDNSKIINLAGKLNLAELVALINKSVLLIANSTGPIHIAAALKKSVVGFYPKIHSASPNRWGPYTDRAKIFQPTLKCTNCTRKQCESLNCMASIDESNVLIGIKELLLNQE